MLWNLTASWHGGLACYYEVSDIGLDTQHEMAGAANAVCWLGTKQHQLYIWCTDATHLKC